MSAGFQDRNNYMFQQVQYLSVYVEAGQLTPAGLSLPVPAHRARS
jgi:hypothetical protein